MGSRDLPCLHSTPPSACNNLPDAPWIKLRRRLFNFFSFFSPPNTSNSQHVFLKGQGGGVKHDGGHPEEDAANEEGEGRVRRQSRAGRGEDEGASGRPQGS